MKHDAIPLAAGGRHWVECTCGWLSQSYSDQAVALHAHAWHVRHVKTTATKAEVIAVLEGGGS